MFKKEFSYFKSHPFQLLVTLLTNKQEKAGGVYSVHTASRESVAQGFPESLCVEGLALGLVLLEGGVACKRSGPA